MKITSIGWIEMDLMFLSFHKKLYGRTAIAQDILTERVYLESISDKTIESLTIFVNHLIKSPGFTQTRVIMSDEEAALKSKTFRDQFPNIKFITTTTKARKIERTIRTIKSKLQKLMMENGENSLYRWKQYIEQVIDNMNNKILPGQIPGEMDTVRPVDINKHNFGKYVDNLMSTKIFFNTIHPVIPFTDPIVEKEIYKFNIDAKVLLAKKINPIKKIQKKYWGEHHTLGGHFDKKDLDKEDDIYKVHKRRLEYSGKGTYVPVYDIIQEDFIYPHVYEMYLREYLDSEEDKKEESI